jgi:hypothetical protein
VPLMRPARAHFGNTLLTEITVAGRAGEPTWRRVRRLGNLPSR